MSDILARAKELAAQHEASGYIHRDATLLLPELVAECEFWQQRAIEEHAALKKLGEKVRMRGKALVEERARAIENNPNRTIEWTHYNATTRAREQLRVEGKI